MHVFEDVKFSFNLTHDIVNCVLLQYAQLLVALEGVELQRSDFRVFHLLIQCKM